MVDMNNIEPVYHINVTNNEDVLEYMEVDQFLAWLFECGQFDMMFAQRTMLELLKHGTSIFYDLGGNWTFELQHK